MVLFRIDLKLFISPLSSVRAVWDTSGPAVFAVTRLYLATRITWVLYIPLPAMAEGPSLIRMASADGSVDLRHPTPDMHSMQSVNMKNVERLEQSAEELSQGGSDIGEEIRRMKQEQDMASRRSSLASQREGRQPSISAVLSSRSRNASTSSYANSIVDTNTAARWGGYSPGGFVTSPTASVSRVSSFRRPSGMPEPVQEGRPLDSPLASPSSYFSPSRRGSQQSLAVDDREMSGNIGEEQMHAQEEHADDWEATQIQHEEEPEEFDNKHVLQVQNNDEEYEPGREYKPATPPGRPQSADTYRQAHSLFKDFDGVHFSPTTAEFVELDKDGKEVNRVSSQQFQREVLQRQMAQQARPMSYATPMAAPPPGENMVFYPAPVPRMLNLPKRLSQVPSAAMAHRRSEFIGALPADARKSAPWLPALDFEQTESEHPDEPLSPPQLGLPASPERISPSKQRQSMFNPRMSRMSMANLPPQLRASVFFDQQGVQTDVRIKSESAVATLDSILAASVNAPVSVFTDHPFAGNVGQDIYAKEPRARRSSTLIDLAKTSEIPEGDEKKRHTRAASSGVFGRPVSMLKKRNSITSMLTDLGNPGGKKLKKRNSRMSLATDLDPAIDEGAAMDRDSEEEAREHEEYETETSVLNQPREGQLAGEEYDDYEEGQLDESHPMFVQPTTLLAELQLRKAQQKSRNRNAGTSFPNGMHSTLLQLDAVAQIERAKRKGQRTRLAWEDPAIRAQEEEREDEDDDVPLGVLYPERNGLVNRGKGQQSDWDRPLGLMERREMEDNEPLSRRRNRLRGISPDRDVRMRAYQMRQEELMNQSQAEAVPLPAEEDEENVNEPLAQRLQRLRQKKALDSALGDVADDTKGESGFTDDVLGHFGALGVTEGTKTPEPAKAEEASQVTNEDASTPRAMPPEGGEEEETLGQRRARLQREREDSGQKRNVSDPAALNNTRPQLHPSTSLANLLTAHPIQAPAKAIRPGHAPAAGSLLAMNSRAEEDNRRKLKQQNARSTSYNVLPKSGMATSKSMPAGLIQSPTGGYFPNMQQQQSYMQPPMPQNMGMYTPMNAGMGMGYGQMVNPLSYQQFAAPAYPGMQMGMPYPNMYGQMPAQQWHMAGGVPQGMHMNQMAMMGFEEPMNPAQRSMVDRWRQSVAP